MSEELKRCPIVELGLCEIPFLVLRTDLQYRFVHMPGCQKCADYADGKIPTRPTPALDKAREALRFYAKESKWTEVLSASESESFVMAFEDEDTNGQPWIVAREALALLEKEGV